MRRAVGVGAAVLALALIAWLVLRPATPRYAVDREDAHALTTVLTTSFARANALKVGTLSGTVQATASDARLNGLLLSDTVMQAPYRIDWLVDLSKLGPGDAIYDGRARVLTLRVPDPQPGAPNVDASHMVAQRRGVFITRDAMDTMTRAASARAAAIVAAKAAEPARIAWARESARGAIASLLHGPLAATGRPNITVRVRFAVEGDDGPDWDRSRTLAQVLGNGHAEPKDER